MPLLFALLSGTAGFGASVGNPTSYTSSIAYTYDAGDGLDRLVSESTPQGTVSYAYDAANRRTQLSAPAQSTTTYTFDNANRLTGISRGTQGVTLGYDNANRRTSLVLPNGINVTYGYDIADQLTSISYVNGTTTVGDLSYVYDAAGRRIAQGGSFARINLPSSISGASYDAGNRLSAWNGNSVTHDLNGNMTAALGQTYSWNERNQLTASTGSVTATFTYDGEGRRRARTVSGATTHFLYEGLQPIQELTSSNALTASLLTGGIDEIFSRSAGGVTQTFIVDALGSTVRLTDSAGAKDTDYTYEAYGKAANDNASNTNPFQYTGRENDGTQLQYNRARYYDPRLARFISEDPIGLAGGYNLFSYVQGNPISFRDPRGLVLTEGEMLLGKIWEISHHGGLRMAGTAGLVAGAFGLGVLGGLEFNDWFERNYGDTLGGATHDYFNPSRPWESPPPPLPPGWPTFPPLPEMPPLSPLSPAVPPVAPC